MDNKALILDTINQLNEQRELAAQKAIATHIGNIATWQQQIKNIQAQIVAARKAMLEVTYTEVTEAEILGT